MIGIIGALDVEVANLVSLLEEKEISVISDIKYVSGLLYGKEVVVAKCGVGKVFAAMCTQTMIIVYKPEIIINTGVAGGLSSRLSVYDLVIADKLVQHDLDTVAMGDDLGMISGINIVDISCARNLADIFVRCSYELGYKYHVGKIATGDQFVCSSNKVEEIIDNFDAIACDMEGGSIAQVCYVNNIDFIVVRCISDKADEKSHVDFFSFVERAAERSIKLLEEFIKKYERNN